MQEATTTLLDITVIFFKQKTCLVAKQRSQIGRTAVSKAIIVIQFRKNIGNYYFLLMQKVKEVSLQSIETFDRTVCVRTVMALRFRGTDLALAVGSRLLGGWVGRRWVCRYQGLQRLDIACDEAVPRMRRRG